MTTNAAAPTPGPAEPTAASPTPAPPAAPAAPGAAAPKDIASLLYDEPDPAPAPPAPAPDAPPAAVDGGEENPPAPPAPAPETTGETIATVAELIEHSQFDPEWFKTLKVDVKVDRETRGVPLSELIASYQIGEAANKRLEEAKAKVQTINQEVAETRQTLHNQLTAAAGLVKEAEGQLKRDFDAVNWKDLEEKDPAKYATETLKFQKREADIKALREKGAAAFNAFAGEQQAEMKAALQQRLVTENEALMGFFPGWKDPATAKAEKAQLLDYLTSSGAVKFSVDEVRHTVDHRLIVLADKARKFDALQDKVATAKQKIVKIPKVLKPGGAAASAPAPAGNKDPVKLLYGS